MISLGEASARMMARFTPREAERVPLGEALGRFLAAPLSARVDEPAFDNSAMDGWAVRSGDVAGATPERPALLRIVGESRAGGPAGVGLSPGEAIRIFTGALLPEGADAVVMQEDAERRGGEVAIRTAPRAGRHVRRRAEVLEAGATFLRAGQRMDPGSIAAAASQGYALVPVHRRPRVAILSTGDELRELGEPAGAPGTLVDSNSHGLAAAVRAAGGVPLLFPLARDRPEELTASVARCLRAADVVITTGGVSVGDHDHVHRAFADNGIEEVFWKVRIKPGKPVRFGVAGEVPVVGLPGNPVSSMVTFEALVRPGLRAMLGDPRPHRPLLPVRLARPMRAPKGRTELARAHLEGDVAHPFPLQGSAAITSVIDLDVLVILEEGSGEVERAEALDLRSEAGSARSPWAG